MTLSQIASIIIFLIVLGVLILDKIPRYIPAIIGGALTIVIVFLGIMRSPDTAMTVLNLTQLGQGSFWLPGHQQIESSGINWQTIIFIAGMMVMVAGMEKAGFFRWICLLAARLAGCRVIPLLFSFMFISAFLSMFIGSITVLLFLSLITIELARLLKFDPVPMIIAEIFASNTGGSATMSGDPPNIIIGTSLGYNFVDFLTNTGVIAWICTIIAGIYFYFVLRKSLRQSTTPVEMMKACPYPRSAISDYGSFLINTGIFIITIVLIITHANTGISVALIGIISAVLTLLANAKNTRLIFKVFDWQILVFFIGLFMVIGGLEHSGVLQIIAEFVSNTSNGSLGISMGIILWLSAIASAIIDNIPFAATMVPIIRDMSVVGGIALPPLAWSLALGTDFGGNGTPIGASANVVGVSVANKEGYPISWGRYMKYALPPMLLTVAVCHILLLLRYT